MDTTDLSLQTYLQQVAKYISSTQTFECQDIDTTCPWNKCEARDWSAEARKNALNLHC